MSISVKELNKLDKETYELIDIRSDAEIAHGVMPSNSGFSWRNWKQW